MPEAVRAIGGAPAITAINRQARAGSMSSSGGPGGFAASLSGGGSAPVIVHVHVAGSVLSENDLRAVMEKQMYRLGMRGSQTWQPYTRR